MVADGQHPGQLDADLEQLVGDPARIGVDDAAGGELVAGREDGRAERHRSHRRRRVRRPA